MGAGSHRPSCQHLKPAWMRPGPQTSRGPPMMTTAGTVTAPTQRRAEESFGGGVMQQQLSQCRIGWRTHIYTPPYTLCTPRSRHQYPQRGNQPPHPVMVPFTLGWKQADSPGACSNRAATSPDPDQTASSCQTATGISMDPPKNPQWGHRHHIVG